MKRLCLALCAIFWGCDQTPPEGAYTVRIVETETIREHCSAGNACYHHGTIFIQPVRGDWDTERMAALGHEMWHAMGNKHE